MCVHREHRTGNCRICWPPVVATTPQSTPSSVDAAVMPLLWRDQGDDN